MLGSGPCQGILKLLEGRIWQLTKGALMRGDRLGLSLEDLCRLFLWWKHVEEV